jgi:hypothetical protein
LKGFRSHFHSPFLDFSWRYRDELSPRERPLRVIAHELVAVIKGNVSIDWWSLQPHARGEHPSSDTAPLNRPPGLFPGRGQGRFPAIDYTRLRAQGGRTQ